MHALHKVQFNILNLGNLFFTYFTSEKKGLTSYSFVEETVNFIHDLFLTTD